MLRNVLNRYSSLFIVAVLLFFALHRFIAPRTGIVETVTSYITYPILLLHSYTITPIQHFFARRADNKQLRHQVATLQHELVDVHAQLTALQSKTDIVNETKEIRSCARWYTTECAILAQVLVKLMDDQQQAYLVSAGSRQEVKEDMVAVYKNNLIGKVTKVYPTYSKVQLITDKACKVAAYCATTKAQGIHEGRNSTEHTSLSFVSHLQKVQQGDKIISSGTGLIFPRGFALGTITRAVQDGLYYDILVSPIVDLQTLDYVYLIAK